MSSSDASAPSRRRLLRALAGITVLAALAGGCTVRPVYMQPTSGGAAPQADLSAIAVADVGDRVAQEVRNNLVFGFTGGKPAAPARYDLTLNVATSEARLGFEKDETAPAYQVTVTVRFELKEIASGRIILRSSSNGVASYDRSNQNFANIRARVDAENRAALQVSEHLQLRLAIALAKERPIDMPSPVPAPVVVPGPSSQPRVPAPN